jgi:hypothetical protein
VGPGSVALPPINVLDYPGKRVSFGRFYDVLHTTDVTLSTVLPDTYSLGWGLPAAGMMEYIESILASNPAVTQPADATTAIFGFVSPATFQTTLVPTSFKGLLSAFARVKALSISSSPLVKAQMKT